MDCIGEYYLVTGDMRRMPLADHLAHGYEDKWDFYDAVRRLVNRWKGRVGECINERHGFLRLRFNDTPGGKADEDWLPTYMLDPVRGRGSGPDEKSPSDEVPDELDRAFGFD